MTCITLFSHISIYDIFGETGCFVFYALIRINNQLLVIGGFGMAIFRIICVENPEKQIGRANLAKTILSVETAIVIGLNIISTFGIYNSGWEKIKLYQFCMDYSSVKGNIHHLYINYEYEVLGKYNRSIKIYESINLLPTFN